ncbi:hypothetical protein HMPREF3169_02200 [Corynebacterium sp. HMSC08C04]|nr:hypothetical protein HMPREF2960_06965 [Corynebacterium sp. HMSC070B05]OFT35879.1 hypothetical protein HMPREF3169_02200 [Corynebacterium sp. HMSC08C04]RUQ10903.1 hypothetical protein D8M31_10550 [Corynebacterium genitalium]
MVGIAYFQLVMEPGTTKRPPGRWPGRQTRGHKGSRRRQRTERSFIEAMPEYMRPRIQSPGDATQVN